MEFCSPPPRPLDFSVSECVDASEKESESEYDKCCINNITDRLLRVR